MDQFLDLTPKQALFCDEYFKDFNATKAALRAGYSAETALSGYLMTLPKIKCHLQQRGAEAAEAAQVTHQMLLAELKTVGFARMSHFFGADGKPKPMHEVDEDTKAALLNYTVREEKNGATTIKIRMNNKLSALDKLAKHLKFYEAQYPAHAAMYWVISNPVLEEHDRFEDQGESRESGVSSQESGVLSRESEAGEESQESRIKNQDERGLMSEAEVNKRVAEAIAATEERMKAEFDLKLKKVKKAAKEKLKNTEEYPRGEELEAGSGKQEKESGSCSGEWQGGVGSRRSDLDVQMSENGSKNDKNTQEYPSVAGQVVGDNTNNGGNKEQVAGAEVKVFGDREGQYTPEGYLIKHANPNRDKNCPYYDPYSGLYIEKKWGRNMIVKSYLPCNGKRWSRKELTHPDGAPLVDPLCDKSQRG
jgi:hypothetical protein